MKQTHFNNEIFPLLIIKGNVNKHIFNNFIYLSENVCSELSLNVSTLNILRLTNVKSNEVLYASWMGNIIKYKENIFEIGEAFTKEQIIHEEYFTVEKIDIIDIKKNSIYNLQLLPYSNKDYKLIEDNSDYFEENLLNQITVVNYNKWFGFCFRDKSICWFKANCNKENNEINNTAVFGFITQECEINIQYVNDNVKQNGGSENNKYKEKKLFSVGGFKESLSLYHFKNTNMNIYKIKLQNKHSLMLSRFCNEKLIVSKNNTFQNNFPYLNTCWCGNIEIISANDNDHTKNEIILPLEIILNTCIYPNDLIELETYSLNDVIINKDKYYEILKEHININYYSTELDNKANYIPFMNHLQSISPLILNINCIYRSNHFLFSISINSEINNNILSKVFSVTNDFPILIDNSIDFSKLNYRFCQENEIKFKFSILDKQNRYLQIFKVNKNSKKNKVAPPFIKTFYKNKVLMPKIKAIITIILNYFYSKDYNNCTILNYNKDINVEKYLFKLYKECLKYNILTIYLNLNIFDIKEEILTKDKIKSIKIYCDEIKENLKMVFPKKTVFIVHLPFTISLGETNINSNHTNNHLLYKIYKYYQEFISYAIETFSNIYVILFSPGQKQSNNFDDILLNNKTFLFKTVNINEHVSSKDIKQLLNYNEIESPLVDSYLQTHREIVFNKLEKLIINNDNIINENKTFSFDSICGMKFQKEKMIDLLTLQQRYYDLFPQSKLPIKLPSGLLLIGPSGCGKTFLAKAIPHQFKINFVHISCTDILSKYIGQSEEQIRNIFKQAQTKAPSVLFFDEIETLTPKRGTGSSGVTDRIVNQILTYLDGVEERSNVFIIAASSNPTLIDQAILRPGRIDSVILCDYPTLEEKKELMIFYLRQFNIFELNNDYNDIINTIITSKSENFSHADLYSGIYNGFMIAVKRGIDSKQKEETVKILPDDLIKGFDDVNKKVNINEVNLYKELRLKYSNEKVENFLNFRDDNENNNNLFGIKETLI